MNIVVDNSIINHGINHGVNHGINTDITHMHMQSYVRWV
jgi:hypothetical protein